MKYSIILSTIVLLVFACKSRDSSPNHHIDVTHFDTILVNQYEEYHQFLLRDSLYSKLNSAELIDSIRMSICEYQGIHDLRDMEFSFGNKGGKKYYSSNIPQSVYELIFGNDDGEMDIIHHSRIEIDSFNEKVYIHKGLTVRDNRKYKYLLSMLEKDHYIQFLFTVNGKYTPQIVLITVDKGSFKKIDELKVFKSFKDVDEYDIVYTSFFDDFNKLSRTEIRDSDMDYNKIDTIYSNFKISKYGEIVQY